jgi:hypothetical protein
VSGADRVRFFGFQSSRTPDIDSTSLQHLNGMNGKVRSQSKVSFKKKSDGAQQVVFHVDQSVSKDDTAFRIGETSFGDEQFPYCEVCRTICENCRREAYVRPGTPVDNLKN